MVLLCLLLMCAALALSFQVGWAQNVNDNFCDAGGDEPNTSACSHLPTAPKFDCIDKQYMVLSIFSSRVSDGVCDCCDGSDEASNIHASCTNTCHLLGQEKARRESYRQQQVQAGQVAKWALIEKDKFALAEMRLALRKLDSLLPEFTAAREMAKHRLAEEMAAEAAEVEQRAVLTAMLFREAAAGLLRGLERAERERLVAALAMRGKEEGAEAVIAASAGKYSLPGDEVDDTEAIVLAMDSPDDIDAALVPPDGEGSVAPAPVAVIAPDLVDAMVLALALPRLDDAALLELAAEALGIARRNKVARLAVRDCGLESVVGAAELDGLPLSPHEERMRAANNPRPERLAAAEQAREMDEKIAALEASGAEARKAAGLDFGPSDEFYSLYLHKACFHHQSAKYSYSVCPYGEARQQQTLLGTHAGQVKRQAGAAAGFLVFEQGERCQGTADQRARMMHLKLECGGVGEGEGSAGNMGHIVEVYESEVCVYQATLQTPLAC